MNGYGVSNALPHTGLDMTTFVVVGLAILVVGIILRQINKKES